MYDVKKGNFDLDAFKTKNKLQNVFSITSANYSTYIISQTENTHQKVKNFRVNIGANQNNLEFVFLDANLVPRHESTEPRKFKDILAKYKRSYPNCQNDDGWFMQVALTIFLKYFKFCASDDFIDELSTHPGSNLRSRIYKNVGITPHKPDAVFWEDGDVLRKER